MIRVRTLTRAEVDAMVLYLHHFIRQADAAITDTALAQPPQNPDEPFVFEYIDRVIAGLVARIEGIEDPLQLLLIPSLSSVIDHLEGVRSAAWVGWYGEAPPDRPVRFSWEE